MGSFGCTIFAIIPLVQQYESFYKSHDDLLPAVDFKITWSLLIFSGFFFTLGSFAFVRCVKCHKSLLYFICGWYESSWSSMMRSDILRTHFQT